MIFFSFFLISFTSLHLASNYVKEKRQKGNNFIDFCKNGDLKNAKNILNNVSLISISKDDIEFGFLYACQNGHLELVKHLLKNSVSITNSIFYKKAFRYACENGHLDIAKYLFEKNLNILPLHYLSGFSNHLDVMKWLVDISMNGTAKYFISDFDNNIIGIHSQYDIISSTNIENAFISACYCGNIESAKWLYLQSNINISSKNEHAFRYACMHGYLELAKWLLETKPDINISAVDNFAFAYAHPNVIDWLLQIKPMLNLTIKNEKLHLQQYKIDFPL